MEYGEMEYALITAINRIRLLNYQMIDPIALLSFLLQLSTNLIKPFSNL